MILYYPVSALVTLFANILQNPQDARARSDLKLMNSVVAFLTMLERDVVESNGNVRRMLSVCAEFERIARVALDKAERELRGRGKRKQAEREREKALKEPATGQVAQGLEEGKTLEQMQVETQAAYRRPVPTPSLRASVAGSQAGSQHGNSPASWGSPPGGNGPEYNPGSASRSRHQNGQTQSPYMPSAPPTNTGSYPAQFHMQNGGMDGAFNQSPIQNHQGFAPPPGTHMPNGSEAFPNPNFSPSAGQGEFAMPFTGADMGNGMPGVSGVAGSFQQPFVPQDLWQMPMTLEWDWADLGIGAFTPGPMFEQQAGGFPDMNNGNMGPPPQ